MEFKISNPNMPISICGQNNVGKTNTLRAINLFFYPECFDQRNDIPVVKKATYGGSYYPSITLTFKSTDNPDRFIEITRDFKLYDEKNSGLKGVKKIEKRSSRQDLEESEIKKFLSQIEFRFIESIDVNTTELIDDLTSDILDTKYQNSRFVNEKRELKEAYEKYSKGMQSILDSFSADVSEVFHSFKENWDIKFTVPSQVDRFRDMISDDVEFKIDDKSGLGVSNKGSGLQRLAIILLNLEILKRINKSKKNVFLICIDEPDIYLHEGLQKKLYDFIKNCGFQVFYTTHSKNFIDENNLQNIVFLEAIQNSRPYSRVNREVKYITTTYISPNDKSGYKKICEHLGIEPVLIDEDVLAKHNILVEGECDEKYLKKLAEYYGIDFNGVKFIIAYGVTRINPMLDVYNSFYSNKNQKPIIHALFDNDNAGFPEYKRLKDKLKNGSYRNIDVKPYIIKNYDGKLLTNNVNHEIEDLMYPEIICLLLNIFLEQQSMTKIDTTDVINAISSQRYVQDGILKVCDIYTGLSNPTSTLSPQQPQVKGRMCELFDIKDTQIQNELDQARIEHPAVEAFVRDIFNFE